MFYYRHPEEKCGYCDSCGFDCEGTSRMLKSIGDPDVCAECYYDNLSFYISRNMITRDIKDCADACKSKNR